MNKADSERLRGGLEELGLCASEGPDSADVVVLNTCSVRQAAEDAAASILGRLKHDKRKTGYPKMIAVMGCMVDGRSKVLPKRFPYVDVWARPQSYAPIMEAVCALLGKDPGGCLSGRTPSTGLRATAFVPVVHGCDKFCTFCIIPYRRGREVSRSIEEIVIEVKRLAENGVKEVTLLGQNIDSYGHDLPQRRDLADLLYSVHEVAELERIRFLTSHPNDMSTRILKAAAQLPKVCENINLPFQAGNDRVLADMRRCYTVSQYLEKVAEVREIVPNVTLTTDVIVGFPTETRSEFEDTLRLMEKVKFDKVHSAAYSERPGAYAARRIPDDTEHEEKKRRLWELNSLQETIQRGINLRLVNREFGILIDGIKDGIPSGRTRGDKLVYVRSGGNISQGRTVSVTIVNASPWSLEGSCLN